MKNRHQYPPEWNDTIRPDILKRDQYKCTSPGCKIKHRDIGYYDSWGNFIQCDEFMQEWAKKNGHKLQKIHLQIAHLDQNKSNNAYSNLKAMCPAHHLQYDRYYNNLKRKMRGRQGGRNL